MSNGNGATYKLTADQEGSSLGKEFVAAANIVRVGRQPGRKRSAKLLLIGALSGLFGICVLIFVASTQYPRTEFLRADAAQCLMDGKMREVNVEGQMQPECAKTCQLKLGVQNQALKDGSCSYGTSTVYYKVYANYYPSSLSEMILQWGSPEGRIFFGFMLICVLCIFLSFYSWELHNTIPRGVRLFGKSGPQWATVRTMIPQLGGLMLVSVPTRSMHQIMTFPEYASSICHTVGASCFFGGYAVCEAYSVLTMWGVISAEHSGVPTFLSKISPCQRFVRTFLEVCIIFGANAFQYFFAKEAAGQPDISLARMSFISEIFAGGCIFVSHAVICFFAHEFHFHDTLSGSLHAELQKEMDLHPTLDLSGEHEDA